MTRYLCILFLALFLISCTQVVEVRQACNITDHRPIVELKNLTSPDISKNTCENSSSTQKTTQYSGLLSPRIYSGILEPKSFLISNFGPLRNDIRVYFLEKNVNGSVYIENLRNGANAGINQNRGYFPASLNKLPVAVMIMQKVEDGKLSLDEPLQIKDNQRTDTYGGLHSTDKKELPVKELLEIMLEDSDNTAFNVLKAHTDKSDLKRLLDYYDIKENLDYPDRRLEYANRTDLVTPISLYNLFSSLYLSTVLYANDSEYLLTLLSQTDFDINGLADLPPNVTVAQKFGEYYIDNTRLFHDCGIMYVGESRIFYCIMTRNLEKDTAKEVIGHTVNLIYNYVTDTRARLDSEYRNYSVGSK